MLQVETTEIEEEEEEEEEEEDKLLDRITVWFRGILSHVGWYA
jgi:hypothetical protein